MSDRRAAAERMAGSVTASVMATHVLAALIQSPTDARLVLLSVQELLDAALAGHRDPVLWDDELTRRVGAWEQRGDGSELAGLIDRANAAVEAAIDKALAEHSLDGTAAAIALSQAALLLAALRSAAVAKRR